MRRSLTGLRDHASPTNTFSSLCKRLPAKTYLRSVIPSQLQMKKVQSRTLRFRQRFLLPHIGIFAEECRPGRCRLVFVPDWICPHLEHPISDLHSDPRVPNYHPIPEPCFREMVPKIWLLGCWCEVFGKQIQLRAIPGRVRGTRQSARRVP